MQTPKFKYINGHWINTETNLNVDEAIIKNSNGTYIQLHKNGTTEVFNPKTQDYSHIVLHTGDSGSFYGMKYGMLYDLKSKQWVKDTNQSAAQRLKQGNNLDKKNKQEIDDINNLEKLNRLNRAWGNINLKQSRTKAQQKTAQERAKNVVQLANKMQYAPMIVGGTMLGGATLMEAAPIIAESTAARLIANPQLAIRVAKMSGNRAIDLGKWALANPGQATLNVGKQIFWEPLKGIVTRPLNFAANMGGTMLADKGLEKAGVENPYLRTALSFTIGGGLGSFAENTLKHGLTSLETKYVNKAAATGTENLLSRFANNKYFGDQTALGNWLRRSNGLNPFINDGYAKDKLGNYVLDRDGNRIWENLYGSQKITFVPKNVLPTLANDLAGSGVSSLYANGVQLANNYIVPESILNLSGYNYAVNYVLPTLWGKSTYKNAERFAEMKSGGADNPTTGLLKIWKATKAQLNYNRTNKKLDKLFNGNTKEKEDLNKYVDLIVNSTQNSLSAEDRQFIKDYRKGLFFKENKDLINKHIENSTYKNNFFATYRTSIPEGGNNMRGSADATLLNSGYYIDPSTGEKKLISDLSGYTTQQYGSPVEDAAHHLSGYAYHNRVARNNGTADNVISALGHLNGTKNEGTTVVLSYTLDKGLNDLFVSELKDLEIVVGKDSKGNPITKPALDENGLLNIKAIKSVGMGQRSRDFDTGLRTPQNERIVENVDGFIAYPFVKKNPTTGKYEPAYTVNVDVAGGATMNSHGIGSIIPSTLDAAHDQTVVSVKIQKGHPEDLFSHTTTAHSNWFDLIDTKTLPFGLKYLFGTRINDRNFKNREANARNALREDLSDLSVRRNKWSLYRDVVGDIYKEPKSTGGVSIKSKEDILRKNIESNRKSGENNLEKAIEGLKGAEARFKNNAKKEIDLQDLLEHINPENQEINEQDKLNAFYKNVDKILNSKAKKVLKSRLETNNLTPEDYYGLNAEDRQLVDQYYNTLILIAQSKNNLKWTKFLTRKLNSLKSYKPKNSSEYLSVTDKFNDGGRLTPKEIVQKVNNKLKFKNGGSFAQFALKENLL